LAEESKSLLYKLEPLIKRWPAVQKPDGHVHFRMKLLWTLAALLVYFFMANIFIYGLSSGSTDVFAQFRAILAGQNGSLVHLGIGPIVTGSIIMQLFTGAKIIKLDLTKPEDKSIYQGTQKVLVVVMIFVEAVPQVFGFLTPDPKLITRFGDNRALAQTLIILQLAAGSYIVFLLDEVVSKWGIGSGISLFIAAGVSQGLFTGSFNWIPPCPDQVYSIARECNTAQGAEANIPPGTLPRTFYLLTAYDSNQLVHGGGFEDIFFTTTNAMVAFLGTLAIFLIVVYAQSTRVELPLAHGKVRGARGRYPIKLMYASNIPVILMAALLANVNLISLLMYQGPLKDLPLFGYHWLSQNAPGFAGWVGTYLPSGGRTQAISGAAYYLSPVSGVSDWLLPFLNEARYGASVFTYREPWQVLLRVAFYGTAMIGGSIVFAKFWIETTNMGPDAVAKQIQRSGMQIPGFRRDPRIVEKILDRYIPVVTVIGGAAVGALAFSADLIGTVGNVSGTGVLLTVGILHQLYEQIAKEQVMEMHPILRGFFGE
jgi:preprotein translocase subunit SecY